MIQIGLEEHVARALELKAQSKGLRLEEYLASLASETVGPREPRLSSDELVGLIEAEATARNPRYAGTYSREDIYLGRDSFGREQPCTSPPIVRRLFGEAG